MTRLLFLLLGAMLSGCVSTGGSAVNYYLLTPDHGSAPVSQRDLRVGVGPVELPEYLAWPDWAQWEPIISWLESKRSQP